MPLAVPGGTAVGAAGVDGNHLGIIKGYWGKGGTYFSAVDTYSLGGLRYYWSSFVRYQV